MTQLVIEVKDLLDSEDVIFSRTLWTPAIGEVPITITNLLALYMGRYRMYLRHLRGTEPTSLFNFSEILGSSRLESDALVLAVFTHIRFHDNTTVAKLLDHMEIDYPPESWDDSLEYKLILLEYLLTIDVEFKAQLIDLLQQASNLLKQHFASD